MHSDNHTSRPTPQLCDTKALASPGIEVRHTQTSRGRGVFATRFIHAGETLELAPVLVLDEHDTQTVKHTTLYNYFFQWGKGKTALVLGFGSMYNHSDTPNAKHIREFESLQMRFESLVDIAPDAEIFVNYLGDYEGRLKNKSLWFEKGGSKNTP